MGAYFKIISLEKNIFLYFLYLDLKLGKIAESHFLGGFNGD